MTTLPEPYTQQPQAAAPAGQLYYPQPFHPAPSPAPFSQPQLVRLENGAWVHAHVPPAPPVVIAAAPEATPRRPLSRAERSAITIVGSICALTLSAGGAIAMAGPHLADAATLVFATAALLGTGILGWLGLRLFNGISTASTARRTAGPTVTNNITNHVSVSNGGFMARGNATGIDRVG